MNASDMLLRDYFAAHALVVFSSSESIAALYKTAGDDAVRAIAESAYELADAMLRARTVLSPRDVQDRHIATWTEGHGK